MDKMISGLKGHYIICGAGEACQSIVEEFLKSDTPFVVIDRSQTFIDALIQKDIPGVKGDSALNETLKSAGIERARGLIAAHSTDAENLLTVLTARKMNADMRIVTNVFNKENDEKLKHCGADTTILINDITGRIMATVAINPSGSSFLDEATAADEPAAEEKPVTPRKKAVAKKPAATEKPVAAKKKVTRKPAATEKPVATKKKVTRKPAAKKQTNTDSTDKNAVDKKKKTSTRKSIPGKSSSKE